MTCLTEMLLRCKRAAITGALIETIDGRGAQRDLVLRLFDAKIISPQAAELLLEVYGLEQVE